MYTQLLNQRNRELGHVVNVVGGFVETNFWYPDGKTVYDPVSGQKQHDAVKFLIEHAVQTPTALINPDILGRLEAPCGAADRISNGPAVDPGEIRSTSRGSAACRSWPVRRLSGRPRHRPDQLMNALHEGIWSELGQASPAIDLYRRNLQRAFVDRLAAEVRTPTADSDLAALARGELERILGRIKGVESGDPKLEPIVKFHLEDLRARIDRAFSPYPIPSGAPASPAIPFPRRG